MMNTNTAPASQVAQGAPDMTQGSLVDQALRVGVTALVGAGAIWAGAWTANQVNVKALVPVAPKPFSVVDFALGAVVDYFSPKPEPTAWLPRIW